MTEESEVLVFLLLSLCQSPLLFNPFKVTMTLAFPLLLYCIPMYSSLGLRATWFSPALSFQPMDFVSVVLGVHRCFKRLGEMLPVVLEASLVIEEYASQEQGSGRIWLSFPIFIFAPQ